MIRSVARRALGAVTAASAVVLMTLPAIAAPVTLFTASDFYIPRPAANSDQVGVERLLISFDVAAAGFEDLIGQTCAFTIEAENGESVHLNNYGVLHTGAATNNQTTILETESLPNVVTTTLTDNLLTIGSVMTLNNVMLPDPNDRVGTSVDYEVIVDCDVDQTTTTTAPTTTTTEPTTTTTGPTTTTTAPTTTTTTEPTTTTTTEPTTSTSIPGPTTTTSAPGPTTSTSPGDTTTTTGLITTTTSTHNDTTTTDGGSGGTSSTTVPPVPGSTLPFTGPVEAAGVAMAATALLMLGAGLLMAAKQES